ncbi:MAG: rhodanese-like domain-containing protein [Flavobacteriales bacterium]|jgi:rhodanese-related sulfurtransferase
MFGFIKKLMGGSSVDVNALIASGAKVIDVRTPGEFSSGHVKGAVNIPLDQISSKLKTLKKDETYVLCCRSGMRSGNATRIMKAAGFTKAYNGGSWMNLK